MDKIKIAITGRVASVEELPEVVADNAEYEVDFALDPREGWDMSLPITALFVRRDGSYTPRILDAGETSCIMPPQTGTNIVFVGLTQDDMRTTTPATIKVHRSIRTVANDPLPEPSEDVYAQILAAYAGIKILSGKGAPTSATQGAVNQLYRDEDTQKLYICTATDGGYTWAAVSGGSVDVDDTLTKAGYAADAKAAGDAIGKKIDKAQGTGNAGKFLGIGADGNVTPQDKPVQALAGAAAPTTATAGVVGQEYYVVVNNAVTEMYVCTAVANGTYTWNRVEFGAEIDDTSTEPTKVWSAEKCNQLSEEIANLPSGGSGLTTDEKTLLLTLVKNAKYAENVQPAYEQLEALFNGGAIVTYTVTNNLTDLTTDNEAATITAGFPYKATLSDAAGNKPKSVEVVMGSVDVSGEYYADGVIDIPSVGGELVITAFAKNTYPVIYKLANTPVTCNADLYEDTGLAFGSGSADGYTKSWTMVARVKNASAGYLWCVNGQKALSSYYENKWNSDAGDKVMTINTYICNTAVSSGITQANPGEVCIVITKEALSEKTATVHYLSWAGAYVADTVTGTYGQFFNSIYAANMMVGGQMGADFVGTIEEFVIYEGIMQEDEIKVVLGV